MIYIACPYSHENAAVRQHRVDAATRYATYLAKKGKMVYSPLSHSENFGDLPEAYWRQHGLHILRTCNIMHALILDGWRKSNGVAQEMTAARSLGIPIYHVDPRWV